MPGNKILNAPGNYSFVVICIHLGLRREFKKDYMKERDKAKLMGQENLCDWVYSLVNKIMCSLEDGHTSDV